MNGAAMPLPTAPRTQTCHTIFLPSFMGGGAGAVYFAKSSKLQNAEVKAPPSPRAKNSGPWHEVKQIFNFLKNSVGGKFSSQYAERVVAESVRIFVANLTSSIEEKGCQAILDGVAKLRNETDGVYEDALFERHFLHFLSGLDSSMIERIEKEFNALATQDASSEILKNISVCISYRKNLFNNVCRNIDRIFSLVCNKNEVTRVDLILNLIRNFGGFGKHGISVAEVAKYVFNGNKLELHEVEYLCSPEKHSTPLKNFPEEWGVFLHNEAREVVEEKRRNVEAVKKEITAAFKVLGGESGMKFFATALSRISGNVMQIAKVCNSKCGLAHSELRALISDFTKSNISEQNRKKILDSQKRELHPGRKLGPAIYVKVQEDSEAEFNNGKKRFDVNPARIPSPVFPVQVVDFLFESCTEANSSKR